MKLLRSLAASFLPMTFSASAVDETEIESAVPMTALSCAINKAMAVAVENGFDQQRVVIETNPGQGAGSVLVEIASPSRRGGGFEVEVRTEDCEVVDVVWLQ